MLRNNSTGSLGVWLREKCTEEGLSLRQAAAKTGLSHGTIDDIIKGGGASAETIRKLAQGFSGSGDHQRLALEDELLVLAGYRTRRPEGQEPGQPLARLMDIIGEFSESQLKIMSRFAEFIAERQRDDTNRR